MEKVQLTRKQHEDLGAFFDLLKSDSGLIEGFFLKPDGQKVTQYFNDRLTFIQSVAALNHHGFTCYAGIQPRNPALIKSDQAATGNDVTALRLLAVDLDACKPKKVNSTDQEKQACLTAARNISLALTNGNLSYEPPVMMDSGSGCWLFMPIPEIRIDESNRRGIAFRLKTWGRRFRDRFQQEGIEIDESIFELHRLTKIPGTKVFSYPDEPDRPQRISALLTSTTGQLDEKLRNDFLTMPVDIPPERKVEPFSAAGGHHNIDRIFERCHLLRFMAEKGSAGASMPHNVRLAMSTFSDALGDLDNDLAFIKRIIGGCPDFSEAKTRRYLELNKGKSQPYGCDALRGLALQHFKDFDASQCQCALPVSHDQAGTPRKPSPIRFAGIMPEDLKELFAGLELSGDPFQDFLKMKKFSEEVLTSVDSGTAKKFFDSVRDESKITKGTVSLLLKSRKVAASEDTTQAQRLIELAGDAEFFKTAEGQILSTVAVDGHYETWPVSVKSSGFRNWLKRRFYLETGKPPSSQPLQDALGILEARGQFDGAEHKVFTRVAEKEDRIYIDLANDRWEAIEITPSGWNVVVNPPVKFRRSRGMGPLPYPVKGHSIEELRKYLNLSNDDDFKLIVSWMVAAMRPSGPYPVLIFNGEQGTAKSTATRILKKLIDNSTALLRTAPAQVRDLMIGATNNWLLCFDNLSELPVWVSNSICKLSTGGGFAARENYSDDLEIIFDVMRGVILNGIEDIVSRHDLADRAIIIGLSPIPEERRIAEKELWAALEKDAPGILGALCDAVSCGLKNLDSTNLDRLPRMADFAKWIVAAEPALPWEAGGFMAAYARNLREVVEQTLYADLVASAVRAFMEKHPEGFEGPPTDLLTILGDSVGEKITKLKIWPKAANVLSNKLKAAATSLRASGIEVSLLREGHGGRRIVTIRRVDDGDDPSSMVTINKNVSSPSENEKVELYSNCSKGGDDGDDGDDPLGVKSQKRVRVEI